MVYCVENQIAKERYGLKSCKLSRDPFSKGKEIRFESGTTATAVFEKHNKEEIL